MGGWVGVWVCGWVGGWVGGWVCVILGSGCAVTHVPCRCLKPLGICNIYTIYTVHTLHGLTNTITINSAGTTYMLA